MMRTIRRLSLLVVAALLTGCVERKFVIESSPPGAQVFRNGVPIGFTPVDDYWIYSGEYDFTLVKDGYETLHAREYIKPKWYQIPPIDLIAEAFIPHRISDVRRLHFQMQPLRAVRSEEVLGRAQDLRSQGRMIGDQPAPPQPVVPEGGVVAGPPPR
jgi:hypothetical protein